MACQILISNKSGIPKTEIVTVVGENHTWSSTESMQDFLASGGLFADWPRVFSILKVADKPLSHGLSLQERKADMTPRWAFLEPQRETQEWKDLYFNGEVERTWAEISQYLVER